MTGRNSRAALAVGSLLLLAGPGAAQPPQPLGDFPPTTAEVRLTLRVGEQVTIGGPGSANFLPSEVMNVYVVPHRVWRDGDPLAAGVVHRGRVRSNANGQLLLTQLWKPGKAGRYDIIVDYDGDGRFSYSLDAVHAVEVRAK